MTKTWLVIAAVNALGRPNHPFLVRQPCYHITHLLLLLLADQQRTFNKLLPELRCRNFVNKHRLSIQIDAKHAKTCMQCVYGIFQLSFYFVYHHWRLGTPNTNTQSIKLGCLPLIRPRGGFYSSPPPPSTPHLPHNC